MHGVTPLLRPADGDPVELWIEPGFAHTESGARLAA